MIDLTDFLARTAARIQNRNLASLVVTRQGPGGAPLEANRPYTIRRKKHSTLGVGKTGEMLAGLTDPGSVNVRSTRDGGSVEVFGGPGGTDKKLNMFVRGHGEETIGKRAKTKSGKVRTWKRTIPAVPARDFFGVSEIELDAAADDLTTTVALALGFHEE